MGFRPRSKYFLKGTFAPNHLVSIDIVPNVSSIQRNRDVSSALSAHFRTGRLKNNQTKSRRRMKAKVQLLLCSVRQLGCVFLDTEPPDSKTTSWKCKRVLEPIRRVRFTMAALRQANIRKNKVRRSEKFKSSSISEVPTP